MKGRAMCCVVRYMLSYLGAFATYPHAGPRLVLTLAPCSPPVQDLHEAMQQPDDRGPRGKSARQKALDELVRRYCLGDMRAGGRDEAMEAAANAAAAETRVVLLQWRLEQERGSAKATQRATLHQNSQLLRELQVRRRQDVVEVSFKRML